jgi:Kef-type K+ transport system membrane component KefB
VPFIAGWGLLVLWPGHSRIEAIFLGAAMVATSVGITARVLSARGLLSSEVSRVILAAAVIDDIIGLLVLAVVSSLATGRVNYLSISLLGSVAIAFTILVIAFGARVVNRIEQSVRNLKIDQSLLIFALVLCFGLAAVSSLIGIAGIIGAFLAGVALSELTDGTRLHQQSQALTEFTTPFFLIAIGMKLNLAIFVSWSVVWLSLVVIVLAILTKFIGCGLGALGMGRQRAVQVGVGMIPRGEVGIVVAQIGLALAAVSDVVYGVVLAMSVITTLVAPPLIKSAFSREPAAVADSEYDIELREEIG